MVVGYSPSHGIKEEGDGGFESRWYQRCYRYIAAMEAMKEVSVAESMLQGIRKRLTTKK
ncbi:hypothetical protein HanXRQr2_Chr15g0701831 [Helianthus annuus]|uniref:Uncharacterized protein n=1 Tax=Helianthus annuus TaxID=4232 RepID=A0A9K3E202_HELAN|nr:hypothetical protein HanXRQr2_Chr15g0701831 [Helianthus annuus]KAJ0451821.1 hypothetical protein HanHA300_Chr15g0571931 [Helianthus annuus]KAJ0473708.1 hypothetical protein HanHA89_Chr15g0621431 [Helianthus annuus]KAJ0649285.1 hypothetical protein HanLR1_Chr15g0582531 [Helianthus annuus]